MVTMECARGHELGTCMGVGSRHKLYPPALAGVMFTSNSPPGRQEVNEVKHWSSSPGCLDHFILVVDLSSQQALVTHHRPITLFFWLRSLVHPRSQEHLPPLAVRWWLQGHP